MNLLSKRIILALIFILGLVLIAILRLKGFIEVDYILENIQSSGTVGIIVFILVFVVILLLWFPAPLFAIAGGFIFGHFQGFLIGLIASMIAAMISFFLGKYLFHDYFQKRLSDSWVTKFYKVKDQKKLSKVLLWGRILFPIVPFNVLNYGFALTKIKTRNYFFISLIGMVPEFLILSFLGGSFQNILSGKFIIAISILTTLVIFVYFFWDKIYSLVRNTFGYD